MSTLPLRWKGRLFLRLWGFLLRQNWLMLPFGIFASFCWALGWWRDGGSPVVDVKYVDGWIEITRIKEVRDEHRVSTEAD